jgi:hypothetical protein
MNKEEIKELIEDYKILLNDINQYRLLTNGLVNENITEHNIDLFCEENSIKTIDNRYEDYSYDLYGVINSGTLKRALAFMESVLGETHE